jgi:hypothetical protein
VQKASRQQRRERRKEKGDIEGTSRKNTTQRNSTNSRKSTHGSALSREPTFEGKRIGDQEETRRKGEKQKRVHPLVQMQKFQHQYNNKAR